MLQNSLSHGFLFALIRPNCTYHLIPEEIISLSQSTGIKMCSTLWNRFSHSALITTQCTSNSILHIIQTLLCNFTLSNVDMMTSTGVEFPVGQSVVTLPFSYLDFLSEKKSHVSVQFYKTNQIKSDC